MSPVKDYLRSNINPELWNALSDLKKIPSRYMQKIVRIIPDAFLNLQFALRKRKGFKSVPCMVPFMRLEFTTSGNVTACCGAYTKVKSVGNINKQTIEQIWNSSEIKRFRKLLLMGQTGKVCKPTCQYLYIGPISVQDIRTETDEGKLLYEDICDGRVKLRTPPLRFNLANHTVCNLKCVMCASRQYKGQDVAAPEHLKKMHENLKKYFDKRITIMLAGEGDVLARKDTRELLQNFDSRKFNKVNFQIITNGLLFQPQMWETIKHNNFTYANISVDAATKKTYEKLRKGGKWEHLMKALDVFKRAKEEGKFSSVNINMTVMRSNFKEIPEFIQMARSRGFHSFIKPINGSWGNENIFELHDDEALAELKSILSTPNLYGNDVDMNELRQFIPPEYRPRMGNHYVSIWYPSHILKGRDISR